MTACFLAVVGLSTTAYAGISRSGGGNNCNRATNTSFGGHSFSHNRTNDMSAHTSRDVEAAKAQISKNATTSGQHSHENTHTGPNGNATVTHTGSTEWRDSNSFTHDSSTTVTKNNGTPVYSGNTSVTQATDMRTLSHAANLNTEKASHQGSTKIVADRTGRTLEHDGQASSESFSHEGSVDANRYSDSPYISHYGQSNFQKVDGSTAYHEGYSNVFETDGNKEFFHSGYFKSSDGGEVINSHNAYVSGFTQGGDVSFVHNGDSIWHADNGKSGYHSGTTEHYVGSLTHSGSAAFNQDETRIATHEGAFSFDSETGINRDSSTVISKDANETITHTVKTSTKTDEAGNTTFDRVHSTVQTVDGNPQDSHEAGFHTDEASGKVGHFSQLVLVDDNYNVLVHNSATYKDFNAENAQWEHVQNTKITHPYVMLP